MLIDAGDMTAGHVEVQTLRCRLGAQLATYRTAAGVSQPELGHALGRTRSMISKIEHGTRTMPAELWTIADDLCGAEGVLIAEHRALAEAEQDHRARRRAQRRPIQRRAPHADAAASRAWPAPPSAARQPTRT